MKPTKHYKLHEHCIWRQKNQPVVDDFSYRIFCLHRFQLSIVHWHTIDTDSLYSHDGCVAIATPQYLLLKRVNFFADTNLNYFPSMLGKWLSVKCKRRKWWIRWRKKCVGERVRAQRNEIKYTQLFSRCTIACTLCGRMRRMPVSLCTGAHNFVMRMTTTRESMKIDSHVNFVVERHSTDCQCAECNLV